MAVITISRQFGAGGKTLGDMIAKKLNYTVLDSTIIHELSKESNVSEDWLESFEKDAGGTLSRFLSKIVSSSYMERLLGDSKGYITEDSYVEFLNNVIKRLAANDNVIVVGRGGQYILQDQKDAYHFLLVADHQDRVKFMMDNYKIDEDKAGQLVDDADKKRLNLYKYFKKQDYDQPYLYNMVFNTSKMALDEVLTQICLLITGKPV